VQGRERGRSGHRCGAPRSVREAERTKGEEAGERSNYTQRPAALCPMGQPGAASLSSGGVAGECTEAPLAVRHPLVFGLDQGWHAHASVSMFPGRAATWPRERGHATRKLKIDALLAISGQVVDTGSLADRKSRSRKSGTWPPVIHAGVPARHRDGEYEYLTSAPGVVPQWVRRARTLRGDRRPRAPAREFFDA
jgi:hypothetical protein